MIVYWVEYPEQFKCEMWMGKRQWTPNLELLVSQFSHNSPPPASSLKDLARQPLGWELELLTFDKRSASGSLKNHLVLLQACIYMYMNNYHKITLVSAYTYTYLLVS